MMGSMIKMCAIIYNDYWIHSDIMPGSFKGASRYIMPRSSKLACFMWNCLFIQGCRAWALGLGTIHKCFSDFPKVVQLKYSDKSRF